jgi:hypothetical protein
MLLRCAVNCISRCGLPTTIMGISKMTSIDIAHGSMGLLLSIAVALRSNATDLVRTSAIYIGVNACRGARQLAGTHGHKLKLTR